MKTQTILVALGLALSPALAMAAPDFSGTWVRDNAKSDQTSYPLYWLSRTTPTPQGGNQEVVVEARQSGGALQVQTPARPARSYILDGRPHVVETDTGMQKASVTATLRGDALTVATVQPYGGMPGNVSATTNETWRLSPDGKVLTVSTERVAPAKRETINETYNRR